MIKNIKEILSIWKDKYPTKDLKILQSNEGRSKCCDCKSILNCNLDYQYKICNKYDQYILDPNDSFSDVFNQKLEKYK